MPRTTFAFEIGGHVFEVSGRDPGMITAAAQAMDPLLEDEAIVPVAKFLLGGFEQSALTHPGLAADLLLPFECVPQFFCGDPQRVQLVRYINRAHRREIAHQGAGPFDPSRFCRRHRLALHLGDPNATQAFAHLAEHRPPLGLDDRAQQESMLVRPFGLEDGGDVGDGKGGPGEPVRFGDDQHTRDITLPHRPQCLRELPQDAQRPPARVCGQDRVEGPDPLAQAARGDPRLMHTSRHTATRAREFPRTLRQLPGECLRQSVRGHRGSMPSLLVVRVTRV